ncbi:MAG TPA: ABC transporter substrate-binding protein [Casimicrobiaceae bacterium]|nr:ABC transporter substrate-binding protein [Casimicrobiaceae bacterium]
MRILAGRWRCIAAALAACLSLAVAAAFVPAHAADSAKVLRVAIPVAETGFDPQAVGDSYSNYVNRTIFDPLYKYDYLSRPFKLVPNTATALPEISADRLTWTMRVRPGIYFADDPVFKGRRRELIAADYVYAIKRALDPAMRSNSSGLYEGRFVGADAIVAKAKQTGKFDYDAPVEGLQAIDRYTLRFKLNFPDAELLSNLTVSGSAAVAREVVEAYGDSNGWTMANPVGTGPYRLKEWRRGQRIVLEANPGFREEIYPAGSDQADRALVHKLAGRKIPMIGLIEISVIEEANPRLLSFEQDRQDYLLVPPELASNVLDPGNRLKDRFAQRGIRLERGAQPVITGLAFNMEDPVVGGYENDKIALRRAIAMAYDAEEDARVIRHGQARRATQFIPPNVSGHNPEIEKYIRRDVAGARTLLDKFGYVDRDGDGLREAPDGRRLTLRFSSPPDTFARQQDELLQRNLAELGLRVEFSKQKWPDQLKAARLGQLQMWQAANISVTSEGFTFLSLLYGENAGFSNLMRFKLPEYDRLYVQARALPEGSQRDKLMQRMTELIGIYVPWAVTVYRYENALVQPWLLGYKYNPIQQHPWQYLDIDLARRASAPK